MLYYAIYCEIYIVVMCFGFASDAMCMRHSMDMQSKQLGCRSSCTFDIYCCAPTRPEGAGVGCVCVAG